MTTGTPPPNPADEQLVAIAAADLAVCWRVLGDVARNYRPAQSTTDSEAVLIEARRLIEVELREQHGDATWRRVTA